MTSPHASGVVIVGAGQAGSELAFTLRKLGYEAPIVLLGEERHVPYRRPPLSKGFLVGAPAPETLHFRPAAFYATQRIDCRTGARAVSIDRDTRVVRLESGECFPYDALVLATGCRPRTLPIPGADAANVRTLSTIEDAEALRALLVPKARVVIVGGGYIGLETAAAARTIGAEATIVETQSRLLARVTSPEMSAFYADAHRRRQVEILTDARVVALEGGDAVDTVVLDDGRRLPADVVVIAVGSRPETTLAEAAGLAVDDGVLVDASGRSSDPAIFAIGDCARLEHHPLQRRLRLECVSGAMDQARAAAASICGAPPPAATVPWFWSDQYDLKLQTVGLVQGYDRVIFRGEPLGERFVALYLAGDCLVAVDAVNSPKEFVALRKLVAERARMDPSALADDTLPHAAASELVGAG